MPPVMFLFGEKISDAAYRRAKRVRKRIGRRIVNRLVDA